MKRWTSDRLKYASNNVIIIEEPEPSQATISSHGKMVPISHTA